MADFRIRVIIDPSGAQRGGRQVEKSLDRVGASADRTRKLIARAFSFAIVASALTRTIGLLANFEQQMASVRAISGATEAQFSSLREEAKRLGITTRFSASQAAEGMVFLARAGFEVDEVMGSIEGTLRLAQAGVLDVGTAADIASNILQGFRLEVDQTGRVVDVLALAANSANTTVGQLGQGMKFVAPVAAGLGVSLEETTAAMAALSDAGLQSTLAGTGLRRVLSELESPAKKTTDILAGLGLAAEDVRVSQVGLITAIQRLAAAGVDTGQALELFGDRGGPAFEVLSSSIPKILEMNEALANAGGTAERIARIMDDNLKGALFAVGSALEGIIVELGDAGATGALEGFFRALAKGLRGVVANIDVFINILETLAIVLGVKLASVAIPAVIAGVKALTLAILANPIGAIAVAATLAVSALIAFSEEISVGEGRLATLQDVGQAAFEAMEEAVSTFVQFFDNNFGIIADLARDVFGDVEFSVEGVLRVTARVIDGMVGLFKGGADAVQIAFENVPAALESVFKRAINGILSIYQGFIGLIIKGLNILGADIGDELVRTLETFKLKLTPEAEDIGARMDAAIAAGIAGQGAAEAQLDKILDRAEEIARERLDALPGGDEDGGLASLGRGVSRDLPAPAVRSAVDPEFSKLLQQLEREGELLKLSNSERDIQQGLLAAEKTLKRSLTDTERERVEGLLRTNQALEEEAALLDSIRGPQVNYNRNLATLNRLLESGAINAEEFRRAQRDMRLEFLNTQTDFASGVERTFLDIQRNAEDSAQQIQDVLTNAFKEAEDAFVDFVKGGELNFEKLVDSIEEQLLRLAFQNVTGQLGASLGFGKSPEGGGIFADLFGGGGGGIGELFSGLGSLIGLAGGGDIMVGGRGGVDNNLLSVNGAPVARVSRGETVTVSPDGQNKRPININFAISTPTGQVPLQTQKQIAASTARALQMADRRNN